MARAAILCIGTEVTRGEVVNTNGNVLAEALTGIGFEVTAIEAVDDHPERIKASLSRLAAEHAALVVTGGLGPTTDDITTAAVAELLGLPLERDPASLAKIHELLARFGRSPAKSNEKQADFPRGAEILPNAYGTAPGFALRIGGALACFLPGVPREMRGIFEASVAPRLLALVDVALHQIRIRTTGMPESEVNDRLAGVEAQFDVTIGYRASFPVVEVKVLARAPRPEDAEARARSAADVVRERLGDAVFGEGDATFTEVLGRELVRRKLHLACAESCTGGLLGQLLTERAGSSEFFAGSAVVYENRAKTALLGVPDELLRAHGAVSSEVARAMAEGARRVFEVDLAVAVTGIAGPGGGSEQKPVGLVHFAVAGARGTVEQHLVFPGDREMIRRRAAHFALLLVRRALLENTIVD